MTIPIASPAATRPCCVCGRPNQPLVEVSINSRGRLLHAHICRTCFDIVDPYRAYPHPETCKCRGTGVRHVDEVMVDDPCEEEQDDEESYYDMARLRDDALEALIGELAFATADARWWDLTELVRREKMRQAARS